MLFISCEPISDEMAKLTKEERAKIYVGNRDERLLKSKETIIKMCGKGELITVEEFAAMMGEFHDLGDGYSKGNIYRLVHLGDVKSVRICPLCGGADINVRQIGYWRTWDSGKAICLDCGWELGYANIYVYIAEEKLISDYKTWMATKKSHICAV